MSNILDQVNSPEDVKKLTLKQKNELAKNLREFTLDTVSKTGGHLASNLGVVELTIALHSVFDSPKDKIIWDVGHQVYIHKILTGRKDKMHTLRQLDGLSGFPKMNESEHDGFDTGHSSTSISVALGMARARDILKKDNKVIAVIGDGALTGGMAQEALNDAGSSKTNIIVILNDNEMSISKNVGGVPMFLSKLRTKRFYTSINRVVRNVLYKIPKVGKKIVDGVRRIKNTLKHLFLPNMYFEDIGFTYLGPVDGHNIDKVEGLLEKAKELSGPILVHVITQKGHGYKVAEDRPDKFHGISSFDVKTGKKNGTSQDDYSKVFGEKLIELATKDDKIVAVTAAMTDGTGLNEYAKKFPDRFFDVGIAEQHALGLVAGMAASGLKPIIPLYSSFLQRGYDQLIHDICMQSLPVVIGLDRAGIVGNDGETHQGIFDLSYLSTVPNINILAPKDFEELRMMMDFAMNLKQPVVIRYPRGGEGGFQFEKSKPIELGKAEIIKEGTNLTIVAIGKMVSRIMEALELLADKNLSIEVINVRFLKPLDSETIEKSILKTKKVIAIEDNVITGGLGSTIADLIIQKNMKDITLKKLGYPVDYIKQGNISDIEKKYGLDKETIAEIILNMIR
ncbi:MAG: 1-deoxy-D-xylulose-5-phosphate synthase [Oscillospiraceae bacterium]|nr:1-deoxy-D-xylulose-5-phosphate synthase [Oscillospiraceae bacterium]